MFTSLRRALWGPTVFIVILMFAAPITAVPFPPVDEAKGHPQLVAFRNQLMAVAEQRDLNALMPLVHPDAVSSFGDQNGHGPFITAMEQEPKRWQILLNTLGKGGKFRRETNDKGRQVEVFYAPYTFLAEIPGGDAMAVVVLAGSDIPVYKAPTLDSKVLTTYSDEALEVIFGNRADNRTWYEVKLPSGNHGFVRANQVVTSGDYRVGLVKHKGKWMLRSFVGGD